MTIEQNIIITRDPYLQLYVAHYIYITVDLFRNLKKDLDFEQQWQ